MKPKPAEQWVTEFVPDRQMVTLDFHQLVHFAQLVQLDAFKAGMSEAAEICNTHRLAQFDSTRDGLDGFRKSILAARDAKTEL